MSYGMEYTFEQLGSAVPAISSLSFLCRPNLFVSRTVWGAEKTLTLCSTAQQQLKHPCVINTGFIANPSNSTIQATTKIFILVKTSTLHSLLHINYITLTARAIQYILIYHPSLPFLLHICRYHSLSLQINHVKCPLRSKKCPLNLFSPWLWGSIWYGCHSEQEVVHCVELLSIKTSSAQVAAVLALLRWFPHMQSTLFRTWRNFTSFKSLVNQC